MAEARVYHDAFLAGITPDELLTVSEWADRYRMLSKKASAEAGRWRTERTPYLRDIMDALSPSHPCEEVVFIKGAQVGAPLALTTPIPTPDGWKAMGDLQPGDFVFGSDGKPCAVLGVSPIFRDRECFDVEFSDGSVITCDGDHLWTVDDEKKWERRRSRTLNTRALLKTFKHRNRNRYAIPVAGPLELPPKPMPVHPYVLGYWLGNGNQGANQITCHDDDLDAVAQIFRECGETVVARKPDYAKGKASNIIVKDLIVPLKIAEVFENKMIPHEYLRASHNQRMQLLQGLMDSDGSITHKGRCEFSNTNRLLIQQFEELLRSLGFKPTTYYAENARPVMGRERVFGPTQIWRVSFTAYRENAPFRLKRKADRLLPMAEGRTSETFRRRIVDIRPAPSVPTRCIMVDSPNHLFLAGEAMIPTHNTECGNNWIGFVIDRAPGPMLAVQPTVEMAKRNSRQKIDPLIQECEPLREKVADPRSRDSGNTMLAKDFPGGTLVMTGANSAVGLRSMSARYLFLDEVDAYPDDVDGEGDPIALAKARTRTFKRRKVFIPSTPTIEGRSKIQRAWESSSRQRFQVPCPHCAGLQVIAWTRMRYETSADGSVNPASVGLECEHCGVLIPEHHKTEMLNAGQWVAEDPANTACLGFHLSSLYSPLGWYSWHQACSDYEAAKANPDRLRTFVNTVLGEVWREKGDAPEWERIYERRERYEVRRIPAGGLVLTAAADVQKDRLECEIVAWGRDRQSWSVDYRVIPGDTATQAPFEELAKLLDTQFPHELGGTLSVRMLGIDAGYNTSEVYKFVRRFPGNRVVALKGQDGLATAIGQPRAVEINRRGKRVPAGIKVWPVGVGVLKSELYSWLRLPAPVEGQPYPAGFCHFPEYGPAYFQMLTAEELVARIVRGYRRYQWEKIRERNEALDCRVYARACSMILGIDRWPDSAWDELDAAVHAELEPVTQPPETSGGIYTTPAPPPAPVQAPAAQVAAKPTVQRVKRSDFW